MTARVRLPNRRRCLTTAFEHGGHGFIASLGYDEAGAIRELFLASAKPSRGLDDAVRDAALILSIGLQFGAPLEVFRAALGRDESGAPTGPVLAALEVLAEDAP